MNTEQKPEVGRLLTISEVAYKSGVNAATIYRRIKAGSFPKQRMLGTRTSRWLESEVDAWIRDLPS